MWKARMKYNHFHFAGTGSKFMRGDTRERYLLQSGILGSRAGPYWQITLQPDCAVPGSTASSSQPSPVCSALPVGFRPWDAMVGSWGVEENVIFLFLLFWVLSHLWLQFRAFPGDCSPSLMSSLYPSSLRVKDALLLFVFWCLGCFIVLLAFQLFYQLCNQLPAEITNVVDDPQVGLFSGWTLMDIPFMYNLICIISGKVWICSRPFQPTNQLSSFDGL